MAMLIDPPDPALITVGNRRQSLGSIKAKGWQNMGG